jgi:uncharacterized protein YraI
MSSDGVTAAEIIEAAFTLRPGMVVESRYVGNGVPTITFNGRLRIQFENEETWLNFVREVDIVEADIRTIKAKRGNLPLNMVGRL